MLKYSDIIEKLTIEQKLSLIASLNNLNNPELAQAGIPCVNYADIDSINADSGYKLPPLSGAVNSWNFDLMHQIGGVYSSLACSANVDMAVVSDIRMIDNCYQSGLTEDPFLSERCVTALTAEMNKDGVKPCFGECGLNSINVQYADKEPNLRALNEYFLRPFGAAIRANAAVSLSYRSLSGGYSDVNTRTVSNQLKTISPNGTVLCTDTDATSQIKAMTGGNLLFNGDLNALRTAYENYLKLTEKVNRGECEIAELENALTQYTAVDESRIDEWVDRVIEFAQSCKELKENAVGYSKNIDAVALKASEESVVLLKNEDNILPLKKGAKVAVIGNLPTAFGGLTAEAFAKAANESGRLNVRCVCDGYAADSERSDELVEKALVAAKGADYAVLFLGCGEELKRTMVAERRLALPANRIALISKLYSTGIKIIAVMDGGISMDTAFDNGVHALLTAPVDGVYCAKALVSVITGAVCPSGRLAKTYYDYPDSIFANAYSSKNADKVKVGTFIGYRYYETAGSKVRYPFGYGLSYTQFQYTSVTVDGNRVTVTVKNTGKIDGSEVVQIYLGKNDSLIIRPKKVLAAFAKVNIPAGKTQTVSLIIDPTAVSSNTNLGFIPEDGEYDVYVCSSVSDVKLTSKISIKGKRFKLSVESISDYVMPQSNVLTEGYVFGDVTPVPQKRNRALNVGMIVTGISLIALMTLVILRLTGVLNGLSTVLFFCLFGVIAAATVAGVITLITVLVKRKKIKRVTPVIAAKKPEEKQVDKQSYEALFEELFDNHIEEDTGSEESEEDGGDSAASVRYVRCNTTWSEVSGKLENYAAERGIVIDRKNVSKLLSALCSSRLVLINGKNAALTEKLIKLVCGFFGSEYFADEYDKYRRIEDMFAHGAAEEEKQVARAVTEAERHPDSVVLSVLNGVVPEDIGKFFMPLARCVNSPDIVNEVFIRKDGRNEKPITITPNLWFIFLLKDGAKLSEIDPYVANIAAYADVDVRECEAKDSDESEGEEQLSFSQFNALAEYALDLYCLNEDYSWKKIDRIIKFIADNSNVKIENRGWRRMERYSSAYFGCVCKDEALDKERAKVLEKDTLDNTVAAQLLLTAVNVSKYHGDGEQGIISLLDAVFNEEDIPECKKIIALTDSVTSD